jgi:hypothetical protein
MPTSREESVEARTASRASELGDGLRMSFNKKRGFTVIELAITGFVMFVLFAIAVPAFRNYAIGVRDTQRLKEVDRFFETKVFDQTAPPPRLKYLDAH